ncbi:MAG: hypothetical protein M1820_005010 [Bogoriella megaspora]|nr:MAG: hypothetical protein M1820_005010 [Bogoriella megaspora]
MAADTSKRTPTITDVPTSHTDWQTAVTVAKEDGANAEDLKDEKHVAILNHGENPPASPRKAHGFPWLLLVTSILMANFLFAIDNTVAANVQPAVVKAFSSLDKLAWLPIAFFASSWGTNLLWYYGSMAILTQMTSERERPLYLNLVVITFGGGTVLGPIIGGAFAVSSATWRWAFYFNLVVGGVCAPVYIFLLPTLNPRPGQSIKERAIEIDYLGIVLLCGFIVSIVMAISFGGTEYDWNSGQIIALFVVAFVLFWLFLAQQAFTIGTTAEHRVFPMHFLKSSTMIVLFLEVACQGVCVFVPVYFLPLYFQFVKADTAIAAGVRMLPLVACQTVVAVLAGLLVSKTGYYVPWFIFTGVLCIAGAALLYTVNQYTSLANIYGYEIMLGLGSGASSQLSFSVASIKVSQTDIQRSLGWEAFAQLGGPTIALGIANSVFVNKAQEGIAALLPTYSRLDISTIISDPNNPLLRNLTRETQDQAVDVVVRSISKAYILCIISGSLILVQIFRFKVNSRLYK